MNKYNIFNTSDHGKPSEFRVELKGLVSKYKKTPLTNKSFQYISLILLKKI